MESNGANFPAASGAGVLNQLRFGGDPTKKVNEETVSEAAKEFESMFLTQMLEHMFKDVKMGGMIDKDGSTEAGDEIYKGFMAQEYGKAIADAGGIGIASQIKQELLKLQEV